MERDERKLGVKTRNIYNACEVVAYRREWLVMQTRGEERLGDGVITIAKQESPRDRSSNRQQETGKNEGKQTQAFYCL